MSSQQKRPAARKRPVPVAGAPRPAGAPAPGGSSRANPPPPRGRWSVALDHRRHQARGRRREGCRRGRPRGDQGGRGDARGEADARAPRLREGARRPHARGAGGGSGRPRGQHRVPPMQKVWRNILHELAGELHLHAESVELEDPTAAGDKFVVVYRKPPVVELTEAEEARRAAAAQRGPRGRGREARRGADGPGAQVRGGGPRPGAHRGRHGEARPARRRADHWRHAQAQARRRGPPPRKRRFPLGCPSTEVSIRVTVATEYARDQ